MAAPEPIAGLIELRFRGLIERPYRSPAQLNLLIDLLPDAVRLPEPHQFSTELLGMPVARAPVPQCSVIGSEHQILLVAEAIAALPGWV